MTIPRRLLGVIAVLVVAAFASLAAGAHWLGLPASAAGMAAHAVCSGVFVAGRNADDVIAQDLVPASAVLELVHLTVDARERSVEAKLPGSPHRYARYRDGLGCTLLGPGEVPPPPGTPEPSAGVIERAPLEPASKRPWPEGNAALPIERWPLQVDRARLHAVVDAAFTAPAASSVSPAPDPAHGANTRAVLVVHQGRLLIERYAEGFGPEVPQLGWSMSKTVLSLLVWARAHEEGLSLDTTVIDALVRVPRPAWAAEWRRDARAQITLDHLLSMRDGLGHSDGSAPWSDVPKMLWSTPDIGAWAAQAAPVNAPGSRFRYSSAVSNLLSRVLRERFASDRSYWQYPAAALFEPIGAHSAVLETDSAGTFIASSYLWATPQDWARIGWLIARDGEWNGARVLPPGWLSYALASAGDRGPYGAHAWLARDAEAFDCARGVRLPSDGILMTGHWGQLVAIFPTQQTVIVRMGWTIDSDRFDGCEFTAELLDAIDSRDQK